MPRVLIGARTRRDEPYSGRWARRHFAVIERTALLAAPLGRLRPVSFGLVNWGKRPSKLHCRKRSAPVRRCWQASPHARVHIYPSLSKKGSRMFSIYRICVS